MNLLADQSSGNWWESSWAHQRVYACHRRSSDGRGHFAAEGRGWKSAQTSQTENNKRV
jgi:hypothetical protein